MRALSYLIFFLFIILEGCSGAPYKREHLLKSLLLYNIHFRRTPGVGADPNALPHEEGFESKPKPDRQLDCQSMNSLFHQVNLVALRECLAKTSQLQNDSSTLPDALVDAHVAEYRLFRETTPVFKLEETKGTPFCMKELLREIPVPREIFFQSDEDGYLSCYNSRISIKEDEFLGLPSFFSRVRLKIVFPLKNIPQTDEETLLLLAAWSITPFWDTDLEVISSVVVPEHLCRQCMGGAKLFLETEHLPPSLLWK
jgi:hypothetical protein